MEYIWQDRCVRIKDSAFISYYIANIWAFLVVKFQIKYAHVVLGYMAMLEFAKMLLKVELWTVIISACSLKWKLGRSCMGQTVRNVLIQRTYTCKGKKDRYGIQVRVESLVLAVLWR